MPTAAWANIARSRSSLSRSASLAARSSSSRAPARREDRRARSRSATLRSLLFLVAGFQSAPPSAAAASAVPSTRARIFANAVSRVVEVSSQNGEKPQSSVVPSCSTGMYSAASSTRSRTSSGVSTRGSIGATTPTKTRWSGFRCCADDLQHAAPVRLAGQRDVEVADLELEQARQQLGVVDVGAVGRVAVAARTGVHADARAAPPPRSATAPGC